MGTFAALTLAGRGIPAVRGPVCFARASGFRLPQLKVMSSLMRTVPAPLVPDSLRYLRMSRPISCNDDSPIVIGPEI